MFSPPRRLVVVLLVLWSAASQLACNDKPFEEPMILGGQTITAETLNKGHELYRRHCIACHGRNGDGDGASGARMVPPPRDFTRGFFKFKSTPTDALPTDEDIARTIRKGLKGTYMNGFDGLKDDEVAALGHFVKTFSPRWLHEVAPAPIMLTRDPWKERGAAIARGEVVYHGVAKCWQCHPAQKGREAIDAMMDEQGTPLGEAKWRNNLHEPNEVDTEYGKLLPTDFSNATLRAAWTNDDLYRTLGAGVGGTKMPSLAEQLAPEDIWAAVHYVREVHRLGALRREN